MKSGTVKVNPVREAKFRERAAAMLAEGYDPVRVEAWLHCLLGGGSWSRAYRLLEKIICGARRKRGAGTCFASPVPGKRRCRVHGGLSTGPRTEEGRARRAAGYRAYCERRRSERMGGDGGSVHPRAS